MWCHNILFCSNAEQMLDNFYRSVLPDPSPSIPPVRIRSWVTQYANVIIVLNISAFSFTYIRCVDMLMYWIHIYILYWIQCIVGKANYHKMKLNKKLRKIACIGRDSRRPRFWALYSRSIVHLCGTKAGPTVFKIVYTCVRTYTCTNNCIEQGRPWWPAPLIVGH